MNHNTNMRVTEFSMQQVLNTDPYCVNALNKDVDYLISFDTDKLLAGFRETAGLDTHNATRYEGWESTLIGGHTLGHYLSAMAQAYVNKGVSENDKTVIYRILSTLIDGLLECQNSSKGKEKFLFGAVIIDKDNVEKQFDNVEKNMTNIITEAWVPWYTLHKLLAGILDTYRLTGYENALTLAKGIGDWSYNRAMGWDEATARQVLRVEYGGMNDALYELYSFTNEDKYAVVAHYFDSDELFERITQNESNSLNNLHANTTIPKFLGALNRYLTCHGKTIEGKKVDASRYLVYAKNFWETVIDKHTYVTGGNSEWEHFGRDYVLDKERTNCNCESCNIYNMLKLSRKLFCITKDVKYANYYENAFYNTTLASQNPETGMTTYFQPMSTGYFKVFSERYNKFWCCTGTGMENFTKLSDSIFFHDDKTVYVNLYVSANLFWSEKNLSLCMSANLQQSDTVSIRVFTKDKKPAPVEIALRIPSWVCKAPTLTCNGKPVPYIIENDYATISEGISDDSVIEIKLPMKIDAYTLPDNDRSIAFKYGPTVLCANLGTKDMTTTTTGMMVTIPAEKTKGYDYILLKEGLAPSELISHPEKYFVRNQEDGAALSFSFKVNGLTFAPYFSHYKERYGIYFIVKTEGEMEEEKKAKELLLLDKPEGKVIDTVQPGYGQYENDELHRMFDWGGSVGSTDNGTTRYAKSGGSFTYHMCVNPDKDNYLSLTFLKEDNGKSIRISSGDFVIYEDSLDYSKKEDTYEIRVKIPSEVVKTAQPVKANGEDHLVIPLCFKGSEGSQSARLFGFVYMMNY